MPTVSIIGQCSLQTSGFTNFLPPTTRFNIIKTEEITHGTAVLQNELAFIILGSSSSISKEIIRFMVTNNALEQTTIVFDDQNNDIARDAYIAGVKHFIKLNQDIGDVKRQVRACISLARLGNCGSIEAISSEIPPKEPAISLTKKEREIVQLFWRGLSNLEIAVELNVSERTVERHRSRIMKKTGTDNTVSFIKSLLKHGLITV